jgi:hypothetical protein
VSWGERIDHALTSGTSYVVVSIMGGVLWVVRRVLTNQAQIEMLQREIDHRDTLRKEDRAALTEVRDDVKEIRKVLMKGSN